MAFLSDHVKQRKTTNSSLTKVSNNNNGTEEGTDAELAGNKEDENEDRSLLPPCSSLSGENHQTPRASMKRKQCQGKDSSIELEMLKTLKDLDKPQQDDEDDIFCKAVACELRKVNDTQEKQKRKAKIYLIATGIEL
ncbi:uncharacterized protein LOC116176540 [Photinus pyralis]|uniref:uncharacterized protein LOC116160398 n=1 Tax=Photinus pyralis TaxID=7054 RepID=UPI0012671089|nr:uncharacterized protein LOC116160398 [Photinus pyralis]XP_031351011.1 uncharacterized protein LOC116176540 [Photinus pyralis]